MEIPRYLEQTFLEIKMSKCSSLLEPSMLSRRPHDAVTGQLCVLKLALHHSGTSEVDISPPASLLNTNRAYNSNDHKEGHNPTSGYCCCVLLRLLADPACRAESQQHGPSQPAPRSSFAQQAALAPCLESKDPCTSCQVHSVNMRNAKDASSSSGSEAHLLVSFRMRPTHFIPGLPESGIAGRLASSFSSCTRPRVTIPSIGVCYATVRHAAWNAPHGKRQVCAQLPAHAAQG